MARIFTEGFESSATNIFDPASTGALFSVVTSSALVRTGNWSYRTGSTGYNSNIPITAVSEFYIRFAVLLTSTSASPTTAQIAFRSGTTVQVGFSFAGTTAGGMKINAQRATTTVATGSLTLLINRWYVIEAHILIADAGGRIEVKVDGIQDIDFTGDTRNGTPTTVDNIAFSGGIANQFAYWDDLAFNDTAGGSDNSWCGDGRILALRPSGDGDNIELTGSDGNQTDNHALVNEPDLAYMSDATFVEGSVVGDYDLYALDNFPSADATIQSVIVEAIAYKTEASPETLELGLKPSGGSESWSSPMNLLSGSALLLRGTRHTTNPATASAWTVSDLNGLQAGARIAA